uniref:Protein regulator of cytokinesis 1 n=1 Tax=Athene cunicularia TaxID=194338 RepID=A0A663MS57_ATHCN
MVGAGSCLPPPQRGAALGSRSHGYPAAPQPAAVPSPEDYTETLLELHDAEVAKMKSCYETHKDLFETAQKWEESWKLFLELERKATDPSRFTNRGGNLLKEEKQRAKLQKTLSKLQEELESRVQACREENEGSFLVKGQQFMEHVTEQWQLYHQEKEKEKQERQLKRSRQIETEMMYGSTPQPSLKRRVLGPNTPGKARKVNSVQSSTNVQGPCGVWGNAGGCGAGGERGQGPLVPLVQCSHWFPSQLMCALLFPSAQWHLHLQRHTQQHCPFGFWGNHLPLTHLTVATFWREGSDPQPPASKDPPSCRPGEEQGECVPAERNHPERWVYSRSPCPA